MSKATKIILIMLAVFVPVMAVGITLLVINASGFKPKDGKAPEYLSIEQSTCEFDATKLYRGHYNAAYPRDEKVERTGYYTEDGYPVYAATWYYDPIAKDEGRAYFECRIGTTEDSIYNIDLRQDGETIKTYSEAKFVDKNGDAL